MQPEQQQRIMGYFIEEAKEHLNTIEQGLLNLQSTIEDPEMINEMFRAAHSVKGGAAMLGINSIQQVAHRLEDFFKVLKDTPVRVNQRVESLFLQIFDALQELLGQLQGPFGLTDEAANSTISAIEPTFEALEQHLTELAEEAGATARPAAADTTAEPSEVVPLPLMQHDTALVLIFQRDVPAQLRQMLQLFKQAEASPSGRQQLQDICRNLISVGEQFDLSPWCALIEAARQAIADTNNPYRTLAPVVIKDIKQAQEFVLAGRVADITPCNQLQQMVPPPIVELGREEDDLVDLLGITSAGDAAELESTPLASSEFLVEEFETVNSFAQSEIEDSFGEAFTVAGHSEQQGPEVGMAELNTLADLFEGEVPDLSATWQEEEIVHDSTNNLSSNLDTVFSAEATSDFSDLLFDSSDTHQMPLETSENLSDLFGDELLEGSTAVDSADATSSIESIEPLSLYESESSDLDEFFAIGASASAVDASQPTSDLLDGLEDLTFDEVTGLEAPVASEAEPGLFEESDAASLGELFADTPEPDLPSANPLGDSLDLSSFNLEDSEQLLDSATLPGAPAQASVQEAMASLFPEGVITDPWEEAEDIGLSAAVDQEPIEADLPTNSFAATSSVPESEFGDLFADDGIAVEPIEELTDQVDDADFSSLFATSSSATSTEASDQLGSSIEELTDDADAFDMATADWLSATDSGSADVASVEDLQDVEELHDLELSLDAATQPLEPDLSSTAASNPFSLSEIPDPWEDVGQTQRQLLDALQDSEEIAPDALEFDSLDLTDSFAELDAEVTTPEQPSLEVEPSTTDLDLFLSSEDEEIEPEGSEAGSSWMQTQEPALEASDELALAFGDLDLSGSTSSETPLDLSSSTPSATDNPTTDSADELSLDFGSLDLNHAASNAPDAFNDPDLSLNFDEFTLDTDSSSPPGVNDSGQEDNLFDAAGSTNDEALFGSSDEISDLFASVESAPEAVSTQPESEPEPFDEALDFTQVFDTSLEAEPLLLDSDAEALGTSNELDEIDLFAVTPSASDSSDRFDEPLLTEAVDAASDSDTGFDDLFSESPVADTPLELPDDLLSIGTSLETASSSPTETSELEDLLGLDQFEEREAASNSSEASLEFGSDASESVVIVDVVELPSEGGLEFEDDLLGLGGLEIGGPLEAASAGDDLDSSDDLFASEPFEPEGQPVDISEPPSTSAADLDLGDDLFSLNDLDAALSEPSTGSDGSLSFDDELFGSSQPAEVDTIESLPTADALELHEPLDFSDLSSIDSASPIEEELLLGFDDAGVEELDSTLAPTSAFETTEDLDLFSEDRSLEDADNNSQAVLELDELNLALAEPSPSAESAATDSFAELDDLLGAASTLDPGMATDVDDVFSEASTSTTENSFAELDDLLNTNSVSSTSEALDLENLLGEEPPASDYSEGETASHHFAELDDLLGDTDPIISTAASALESSESDLTSSRLTEEPDLDEDFTDLEALLEGRPIEPASSTISSPEPAADLEFDELDDLLKEAEEKMGGSPTVKVSRGLPPQRRITRPGRVFSEQTMRVPVKHLDNLSNLVGELVVNRNSLEQDQERLRQSLDNLLYQVQQLGDVGQRMQDLYERSLLESSLLASRQHPRSSDRPPISGIRGEGVTSTQTVSANVEYDPLEMDRFTGFHSLSQEMIELIVRVRESASDIEFVVDETDQVTRMFRQVTTQLQEGLTRSRMVPFAQTADRLPRAVRDISMKVGKQAELQIEGRETLIDKMILEQLYDPMTHLVNNALTHGVESPEVRRAAGKPPAGRITIRAFHQGNQTIISVSDDGAGIDVDLVRAKAVEKGLLTPEDARSMTRLDVYDLLFHPGFTTKDQADDFSGRGVGMDVVRTSLSEIRGVINTDSVPGRGTTFTIRLPLTLSISKALCCISDRARIAFPMDGVEDMLDVPRERIQTNAEGQPCISWRDTLLPLRPLTELLAYNRHISRGNVYGGSQEDDIISVVVLRSAGNFLALQVDQVIGEQEIVIKQLEGPVPKPVGVAGATVLGDGRIMPIADVLELIDLSVGRIRRDVGGSLWEQGSGQVVQEPPDTKTEPTVLIVDDSITVRELLSMTFNKVGYRVEQARDGQEAWEKLRSGLPCDIVFCDIEMPRMDGLELLSRIQRDQNLNKLPIAMLTSRGADRHRQMAASLGASGYFTKPYLEEALLDAAQRMLKGERLL